MFLNLLHEISQRQERFIFNSLKARFWEGKAKVSGRKGKKPNIKFKTPIKKKEKKEQILKASFGTLQ